MNVNRISQSTPPAAPLNPWSWPTRPYAWLHLEFAGPFLGWMFLILIDVYCKWIEVYDTSSAMSAIVMQQLRTTFTKFGFLVVLQERLVLLLVQWSWMTGRF